MKYAVFTKNFTYHNVGGEYTLKPGFFLRIRYPHYMSDDGLLVEGFVAYKMHTLIPREHFVIAKNKAEATALAAKLK